MANDINDKVDALEKDQSNLKCEVREMKVVQNGLTDAVKEIKGSIDKLNNELSWMSKVIIGSIWAAIIVSLIKDVL